MTIRKIFLIVLISVSVLSIGINAFTLSSLTDRYFTDYLNESYTSHVTQVVAYTTVALQEENVSYRQMAIELETHLDDPIIQIKLYDKDGILLVDVDDEFRLTGGMMGGQRMDRMRSEGESQVEQYSIEAGGSVLGVLNITRKGSAETSFVARMFKASLIRNSIFSILIAIAVSVVIGIIISKKMSRALQETADLASDIQVGSGKKPSKTTIKEVIRIRESLENLNTRLKLKQKSRKELIDQLVHQSRTPLTVLKSHLEAIEDGIIQVDSREVSICQDQIRNIEDIISNMSGMIDANKETDELMVESFEFSRFIGQIYESMKAQFNKRDILFELITNDKVDMETDRYKLSQAIYNILTNACKYTETGGNVRISYIVNEEKLLLKIQDTGIGIREEELDKIFQAYYRGTDQLKTEGEGIGLFIAKENMARIKGALSVTSGKNMGSTFILSVPVKLPEEGLENREG